MEGELNGAKKRLYQVSTILLGILALVAVVGFFIAIQWVRVVGDANANQKTITVTGSGEVYGVPDIAEIYFSVVEQANTAVAAQAKATEKLNKATAFLRENKVEDKDIKTTGYNVYPQYEYFYEYNGVRCAIDYCPPPYVYKNEIKAYEVSQSVTVVIRDTENAGKILSGIGEQGISNVSGLNFRIEDEDKLKEEARTTAVANAKAQAQKLASDLGVRLGKIVSFNEYGYPSPIYGYGGSFDRPEVSVKMGDGYGGAGNLVGMEAPVPNIPPGENKITSNVTIIYEIR